MDTEYKVDFKLDLVDEQPLYIKYPLQGQMDYRAITKKDINLYEFLSNAQKNNLNKIGLSRNMLISGQLFGNTQIHQSIEIMKTNYLSQDKDRFIQLSSVSELLLSVLIHDNQNKDQIEQDKINLEKQFTNANIAKAITIIIVNPENMQMLGLTDIQFDLEDQCYGKFIIYMQKKIIYLIPKTKKSKFQLMQLIFLGLARHFKPRYLYIQELNYNLKDNIFQKTNFKQWGAVCPQKNYDRQRCDPLYLEFLMKYDFYVRMQKNCDSYQFDALNCLYNYQKSDNQITNFISCQANESLTQDMDHLNPKFCKLLNQDDLRLIQYGQLDQKKYESINDINQKIHSIKLNQEIKFMANQYIELHPSVFRVLLMKLIALIDYFSISSYLFIIVILPYYFILDQSDNQAIQVFISIIPGFIIILSMILTIVVTIIFSIDDKILTGEQEQNVPIYVFKKEQSSYFVFSLSEQKVKDQIIPSHGQVENEKLLFKINTSNLGLGGYKLKTSPSIQFIPTEVFHKWVMIVCSIFYCILSAAVLFIFISKREGDSNKMAYSTAGFLAFILFFYLIFACRSLSYSQIKQRIYHLIPMFIEVNLLSDIFVSYSKSHSLEQNYQKLQKFLLRIFWNFIIFFAYIIFDYSYNFDGGVICPIVGYYVLKYITQLILLGIASKEVQEGQQVQLESPNIAGQGLITQEAEFVAKEYDKYGQVPQSREVEPEQTNQTNQLVQSVVHNVPQQADFQSNIQNQTLTNQSGINQQSRPQTRLAMSVLHQSSEQQPQIQLQGSNLSGGQSNSEKIEQQKNQTPQQVVSKPVSTIDQQIKVNHNQLFQKGK
ncbi:hypothetical protein pb186bvf_006697 [Paramecium bursaria]